MTHAPAITRVVKLTLQPGYEARFAQIFVDHQQRISSFAGCLTLQAFQDKEEPHVFFTISRWSSTEALDAYRYSSFFKTLWQQVKPMFADKAMAHSLQEVKASPSIV